MKRIATLLICLAGLTLASCTKGSVSVIEDAQTYTLDNGIVKAVVAKESGDLVSVVYQGKEMLATRMNEEGQPDLVLDPPGANPNGLNRGMTDHQYGFWSHDAMGPRGTGDAIASITINPQKNGGMRAEVAVKGISEGRKMGTGPGASADGQFASDIEIRYAIEDGSSKIYTYCIFTHPESYPATAIGEARFCAKLAPMFDWMSVDKTVDFHYPADHYAGDKYVYTAVQSKNPAFGWASTSENIGFYLINPSMEYMSGGPTKVEFMGHRDTNKAAAPCILNYWRSSHYGGAEVSIAEGEHWQKVIGPFVLYMNSGAAHDVLYADARAQVAKEQASWPYSWVESEAYPKAEQRAAVYGKIKLLDFFPVKLENLNIGLVHEGSFWQKDAKHYQFWTIGQTDGSFRIENVIAGKYTLYAFADDILGEYVKTEIEVKEGEDLDLDYLYWKPERMGRQLFDIGKANRNGTEFFMGENFRDPEIVLEYAKMFPDDVRFTAGQSDYSKEWPYLHVPHNESKDVKVLPFFGVMGEGRATPYRIRFNYTDTPVLGSTVTVRAAICGTSSSKLEVKINGKYVGDLPLKQTRDGVITRHGSHGIWYETSLSFDGGLLITGENELCLTIPAGSLNSGIVYDYIRVEHQ